MFDFQTVLRKEKKVQENDFLIFGCTMENTKKKSNIIKVRNLCIFKLFNLYINELK